MIRDGKKVRLTRGELNELRTENARNGNVVNEVADTTAYLEAAIGALKPDTQADLLEFLETGSSPLTRATKNT